MTREQVRKRILELVQAATGVTLNETDVVAGGRLDDFLGLDSITSVEIVVRLEKEFSIRLPPESMTMDQIGDLEWLTDFVDQEVRNR